MDDLTKRRAKGDAAAPTLEGGEGRPKHERWRRETYAPAVDRHGERDALFRTLSDVEVEPLYGPEDLAGWDPETQLGYPGEFPYTRGVHPSGYRGKLWTMRMFAGFGTPEETNRRFRSLLDAGQTGLSTAFDLPTLMGYDADDPFAQGEVGKCGVSVSSLADMEALFDGIDPEAITTSMTINSPANAVWAMYLAMAERRGADRRRLGGTIQNDILKEFIAQKEYIFPPAPSVKLVVDTFEWGPREVPRWNVISVSGYHIREAGSTAVQELAFTLADGFHYVREAIRRGLDVDEFAPRVSFFFNLHNDFFEEIAKLRAARRIWAREMRDVYGAKDPRSLMLRTHAQTAGVSLTAQQPLVNTSRVAIQALAGVLGGVNSLHTDAYDEALSLPTEAAALLALRTQQVVAHETGVTNTVDPLAGSYFLERLTDDMEAGARDYFARIDALGGVEAAIEDGFFAREIGDAAYRQQREIDAGARIVVGVNAFRTEAADIPVLLVDPAVATRQAERVARVRRERDGAAAAAALAALRAAAVDGRNTMPAFLACAHAWCTVGEQMDVLRDVYGTYHEAVWV
jgi:methylmalonyl-CoA mutase, N-terminal domain